MALDYLSKHEAATLFNDCGFCPQRQGMVWRSLSRVVRKPDLDGLGYYRRIQIALRKVAVKQLTDS